MQKNMTNGKNLIIGSVLLIGIIGYFQYRSINSLNKYKNYPSIRQYLNRLSEFFENKDLKQMEFKFLSLIDTGVNLPSAFDMTIKEAIND